MREFHINHEAINKGLMVFIQFDRMNGYTIKKQPNDLEPAYNAIIDNLKQTGQLQELQDTEIKRAYTEAINELAQTHEQPQYKIKNGAYLLLGFPSEEVYLARRDELVKGANSAIAPNAPVGSPALLEFIVNITPKIQQGRNVYQRAQQPYREPRSFQGRLITAVLGIFLESLALITGINVYRFLYSTFSTPDRSMKSKPLNYLSHYVLMFMYGILSPCVLVFRMIINFWDNLTETTEDPLSTLLYEMPESEIGNSSQSLYINSVMFYSMFMTISMFALTILACGSMGLFDLPIGLDLIPEMGRSMLAWTGIGGPETGAALASVVSVAFVTAAAIVTSTVISVTLVVSDFLSDLRESWFPSSLPKVNFHVARNSGASRHQGIVVQSRAQYYSENQFRSDAKTKDTGAGVGKPSSVFTHPGNPAAPQPQPQLQPIASTSPSSQYHGL